VRRAPGGLRAEFLCWCDGRVCCWVRRDRGTSRHPGDSDQSTAADPLCSLFLFGHQQPQPTCRILFSQRIIYGNHGRVVGILDCLAWEWHLPLLPVVDFLPQFIVAGGWPTVKECRCTQKIAQITERPPGSKPRPFLCSSLNPPDRSEKSGTATPKEMNRARSKRNAE
jgi:hypothetical protein